MNNLTRNELVFTLAPGEEARKQISGDYVYFASVPSAVSVVINDGAATTFIQGELHRPRREDQEIERVVFKNTSNAPQTVRVIYGLGDMSIAGVVSIAGAMPLPAGAATEAKQDAEIARLPAALVGGKFSVTDPTALPLPAGASTAAKQDTGNTSLASIDTKVGKVIAGAAALSSAKIDLNAAGQTALIAGVNGQVIRVYRLVFSVSVDTTVKLQDGNTDLTGFLTLKSGSGLTLDFDGEPWFTGTAGNALNINQSAGAQISGRIYYKQQ